MLVFILRRWMFCALDIYNRAKSSQDLKYHSGDLSGVSVAESSHDDQRSLLSNAFDALGKAVAEDSAGRYESACLLYFLTLGLLVAGDMGNEKSKLSEYEFNT